jgi:hypothetical protein
MSGRSYDNPLTLSYSLGLHDYGAGGEATAIPVPGWATRCRIESISLLATETFTATTTEAFVRIGTAADADKFAELGASTLADTNGLAKEYSDFVDNGYGGPGVVDCSSSGENISQLEVVLVAPTGGTPAGIAYTDIAVSWW